MINSISGRLIDVRNQALIVSPAGADDAVELEIRVPAYWAASAAEGRGSSLRAYTILLLESPNQGASFLPRLIGFPSIRDRAFYELFTSVKGLGSRKALRAMAIEPGEIIGAIAARDAKALQQLPEIGKRLAETIIAELHGKLDEFGPVSSASAPVPPAPRGGPLDEAIATLVALGQSRGEAEHAVSRAVHGEAGAETWTAEQIVARAFAVGSGH